MSEADKMFKELGYEKEVAYRVIERETNTIVDISGISMKELQAINKKVEELGWLER